MIRLKIKDVQSYNAIVDALYKNGYKYDCAVVYKKHPDRSIDYFDIQIEEDTNG